VLKTISINIPAWGNTEIENIILDLNRTMATDSSTFRDEVPSYHRGVRDLGNLTRKTVLELAEYARSVSLLEASIGMATINSLTDIDESQCVEKNAFEIILGKGGGNERKELPKENQS
jgi:hypothetical protein